MTANIRFLSAFQKIERAKRHIAEINGVFQQYLKSDFAGPVIEDNLLGSLRLVVKTKIPLPPALSLALGDAVHTLSSSLDHVMHQLVPMKTFPTHEGRDSLIESFKAADPNTGKGAGGNHSIVKAYPDLHGLIVDEIRPYDTGDGVNHRGRAVWALRKLDNIDKHRSIIPVLNVSEVRNFSAMDDVENRMLAQITVQFQEGMAVGLSKVGRGMVITDNGNPAADIRFPEGTYFTDQPIIPTLVKLADYTTSVVQAFETHFKGR